MILTPLLKNGSRAPAQHTNVKAWSGCRLFIDVVHYDDDGRLLLPVDDSDVSIYELAYLADDFVIP